MNNTDGKLREHLAKERLNQIINNNYNFTEQQKHELKLIVDSGKTPEDVLKGILTYFSFNG